MWSWRGNFVQRWDSRVYFFFKAVVTDVLVGMKCGPAKAVFSLLQGKNSHSWGSPQSQEEKPRQGWLRDRNHIVGIGGDGSL